MKSDIFLSKRVGPFYPQAQQVCVNIAEEHSISVTKITEINDDKTVKTKT